MKDVREEYHAEGLTQVSLHDDPLEQARLWVDEAIEAGLPLPNAMTLATVSADGQPSSRVVLLKGIEGGGFTFFTHYDSRKGEEMAANPKVSFTMFWQPFDRQMIVIGEAHKVDREESDSYFASRPYASQVSAAISPQSQRDWSRNFLRRRCLVRSSGAATGLSPPKFSSGMAALVACMTVFVIPGRRTAAGVMSALRLESCEWISLLRSGCGNPEGTLERVYSDSTAY